jgi:hypothetical protein
MPLIYSSSTPPEIPKPEELKSKDLGINLDIGGKHVIKELTAAEKMSKSFGGAYEETSGRALSVDTKIPVISDVVDFIGDSPIGWGIGRVFDVLNLPSSVVQNLYANLRIRMFDQKDLPDDVRGMLAAGKPIDQIADYLVRTNRSFTNDNMQNLLFTLLLDPLNYTPLALGKVGALKPLTTVAGGIVGGAAGGAAVAGPIGMLGGAALGAFGGYKGAKALQGAAATAEKAGELTAATRLVQALDKPRGMNLTQRLREGASMADNIAAQNKFIEDAAQQLKNVAPGSAEALDLTRRIDRAKTAVASFEKAGSIANSVNNKFGIGLYKGLIGSKNTASAGLRGFAGAMMIPATQAVGKAYGGRRANETIDKFSAIFGDKSDNVIEQFGQGMAHPILIAIGKSLIGPESAQAKVFAENTAQVYYKAKEELDSLRALEGATAGQKIDDIVGMMLKKAEAEPGGAVSLLDTNDAVELSERVKILMNVSDIERASSGRGALAAIGRLEGRISDRYVGAKLERMFKADGGVEKALADQILQMGPQKVAQKGVEEIQRLQLEAIYSVRTKQVAQTEFIAAAKQVAATNDKVWSPGMEQAAKAAFDDMFRKYYDEAGNAIRTQGIASTLTRTGKLFSREAITEAAERMALIKAGSFSSANQTAVKINQSIDNLVGMASATDGPLLAQKNAIVERLGQESFDVIVKQAKALGKVTVVKSGYMFHNSVVAARNVMTMIEKLVQEGKSAQGGALDTEAKLVLGKPLIGEYVGGADQVLQVNVQIKRMLANARLSGDVDEYAVLKKLSNKIGKAKNLAEARRAWTSVAIDHFDDLRTQFRDDTVPENLANFLDTVINNRQTLHALTGKQIAQLKEIAKQSGIDGRVIDNMSDLSYTVVRAPERGAMRSQRVVETASETGKKFDVQSRLTPFIDLTSSRLSDVAYVPRYSANRLQELMSGVFAPIGSGAVSNSVKKRMAAYMARGGATIGHVDRVIDELVAEAMKIGVGARGLEMPVIQSAFQKAFNMADSNGGYERFSEAWKAGTLKKTEEFDPVKAVMYAFQGDASVVGLTQYTTGGFKRWLPAITAMTDRMYPQIRFKNNPLFWIQEYIESPFLNAARGVDKSRIYAHTKRGELLEVSAGEVRDLSKVGPEMHAIVDNINFLQTMRGDAIKRATTGDWGVPGTLKGLFKESAMGRSSEYLRSMKDSYKDDLAMDIASKHFGDNLRERDPQLWASLVEHYGTSDSRALFINFTNERRKLGNYDRVMSSVEANRPAGFGIMSLPDKKFDVMSEETTRLFGSFSGVNLGKMDEHLRNPQALVDNLVLTKSNMADSGYDMGTIGRDLEALEAEARIMADYARKNPSLDAIDAADEVMAPMVARYKETLNTARRSFNRLTKDRMKANYRYVAAQQILLQSGFREGAGLSFEGDRIAQALALGHSYGADIGDVASMLQKMVDDVAGEFPDAYIISEQFDEAVGLARPIGMETTKIETVEDLAKASYIGEGALPRKMVESLRARVQEGIAKDPQVIEAFDDAAVRLITEHGSEERVYRAFQESYSVALKQAQITTYANMERSFFERTINHPFLGFYPYSYMFKKILPEMVEFLFKRPFGAMAPGAGYQAYQHVRDYVEHQVETDYFFRKTLEDNDQVAFMVSQLFPGLPWDIAAVPPAYLRSIVLSTVGGRDKDYDIFNDLLGRDVIKGTRFGLPASATYTAGALSQLMTELTGGNKPKPAIPPGYEGLPDFDIGG